MREHSVTAIKPQDNLANNVNRVLSKATLRHCEQIALRYIVGSIRDCSLSKKIHSLDREESLALELCPDEAHRFGEALEKSVREASKIKFDLLNGLSKTSAIHFDIDSKKLEQSFQIYASGSFRREKIRKKYGNDLEILLARTNGEERETSYGITLDCQWHEGDGIPQILTYSTDRNSNNFIIKIMEKSSGELVNAINSYIKGVHR